MNGQTTFPAWVPKAIVEGYVEKGVKDLFEWQIEMLSKPDRSVVFSANTSAGKSLVAELLALRVAIERKKVLFILPYIAVAKEKLSFLQKLWRRIDIQVVGYIGHNTASNSDWTAAVCTLEKANSLLSCAILEGNLFYYGMVVVDELHMLFDGSRGPTLESLITKLIFYNSSCDCSSKIKLIGMSATLPNIEKLGKWMECEFYQTEYRPVELIQCYSHDGVVYSIEKKQNIRCLDNRFRYAGDIDCTVGFCIESVLSKKSTLVFCSSKIDVEKIALEVARIIDMELKTGRFVNFLSSTKLIELRKMLEESSNTLDAVLMKVLPRGVAFHHAGLTSEERECIEKAFRENTIFALVATSTLSSGVNLPASRVIIKAQVRGPAAINNITYKQMAGRAGRTGFSDRGEVIVTLKPSDVEAALSLISNTQYNYSQQRDASKVILESICSGLTPSMSSITSLTLHLLHKPKQSPEYTVNELASQALISRCNEGKYIGLEDIALSPTQLGRAALVSSLPPDAAIFVFNDLKNATKALAIDTELHMMYLVTPINCSVWQQCDWNHLHFLFVNMDFNSKRIAKMVGAHERFLLDRIQGKYAVSSERDYQIHLRFFSALALHDIINEMPLVEVGIKFKLCRGSLQALQQQSATYAAMIVAFCNRLGWQYLRSLLEGFAARLAFGIRAELTELIRINGIDGSRARVFHDRGITSLAQLSQMTAEEVAAVLSMAVPFVSNGNNGSVQEWLYGEEKMLLREAADLVIYRANEEVRHLMRNLGIDLSIKNISTSKTASTQLFSEKSQKREENITSRVLDITTDNEPDSGLGDICRSPIIKLHNIDSKKSLNYTTHKPESMYVQQLSKKRLSVTGSQISDDSALDIFNNSIMELTLEDDKPSNIATINVQSNNENILENDIEDLETTLLKIRQDSSFINDSFEETIDLIERDDIQKFEMSIEDSFDVPLSQIIIPKTQYLQCNKKRLEESQQECINTSNSDIFNSPVIVSKKRNRNFDKTFSPSTSSPVSKFSRKSNLLSFTISDVCGSKQKWKAFIHSSSQWKSVAVVVVQNKNSITALCLCAPSEMPVFLPLSDDDFRGSSLEEANYPFLTQSQEICMDEKIAHIKKVFDTCVIYFFKSLEVCKIIEESLEIQVKTPICIEYLSFLAHHRNGENAITLDKVASLFNWPFPVQNLLKHNTRISSSVQAYILSHVYERLYVQAKELSSKEAVDLEMKILRVVSDISSTGFYFNQSLCSEILQKIQAEINTIEERCHKIAGKAFNLESPHAVSEVLFKILKIPYPGGTISSKKHLSANKVVLLQVMDLHPIIRDIMQYRQLMHAVNHCILPLQPYVAMDGKIRSLFDVCTATGRILTKSPSIQNVPKNEILEKFSVRALFMASSGRVLIAADYCQLELRVLAHLSGDPNLLQRFSLQDSDIFQELSNTWGFSRDSVKQLCYGLIYGMGTKALAEATKTTTNEAQSLLDNFFTTFPKVRTYISETKEESDNIGFVSTFLGKRRISCRKGRQEDRSRDHRQAINFTIQGTASEIFKKAIVRINERFEEVDAKIIMIIHDEIIVECSDSIVNPVTNIIRYEMENVFQNLRVPLSVKIKVGKSWNSLK